MDYLSELTEWFTQKIKIHNKEINIEYRHKKWEIWFVDFWVNIGSEFNYIHPAMIFMDTKISKWGNVIVIPLTTFTDTKNMYPSDYIIQAGDGNLQKPSILRIWHMRDISKKRLIKRIGRVWAKTLDDIDLQVIQCLGIKNTSSWEEASSQRSKSEDLYDQVR